MLSSRLLTEMLAILENPAMTDSHEQPAAGEQTGTRRGFKWLTETDEGERKKVSQEFRHAFINGLVGTLFVAVLRTSVLRFHEILETYHGATCNGIYTWDNTLRYGYMLWFLFYFLFSARRSNKEKESLRVKAWDWVFAIIQAAATVRAAVYLNFLMQTSYSEAEGYRAATASLAIICLCSLCYVFTNEGDEKWWLLAIRTAGAVVCANAWYFFAWLDEPVGDRIGLSVSLAAMIGLLVVFALLTMHRPASAQKDAGGDGGDGTPAAGSEDGPSPEGHAAMAFGANAEMGHEDVAKGDENAPSAAE
jgi:hypothetical protein